MLDNFNASGIKTTQFMFNGTAIVMLTPDEERAYGIASRDYGDEKARKRLAESHIPFALKFVGQYKGYAKTSVEWDELKSQAFLGLAVAAEKFDPDKGLRFATYAVWWLRAKVLDHVVEMGNTVKASTSPRYKKAFFKLSVAEKQIRKRHPDWQDFQVDKALSEEFEITVQNIQMLRQLKAGPQSLNTPLAQGEGAEYIDLMVDNNARHVDAIAERSDLSVKRAMLSVAMQGLNDRERHIFTERKLKDMPPTLEELGIHYDGLSKERIRQIEKKAMEKVTESMRQQANQRGMALTP